MADGKGLELTPKANLNPNLIKDNTAVNIDRLLLWGSTSYGRRLPSKAHWLRYVPPTGEYTSIMPTYTFSS